MPDRLCLDEVRCLIELGKGVERGCIDKEGGYEGDQFDRKSLFRLSDNSVVRNS
jgi:hypothetical protein